VKTRRIRTNDSNEEALPEPGAKVVEARGHFNGKEHAAERSAEAARDAQRTRRRERLLLKLTRHLELQIIITLKI